MVTDLFPARSEAFIMNQARGILARGWDLRIAALKPDPPPWDLAGDDAPRLKDKVSYRERRPRSRPAAWRAMLQHAFLARSQGVPAMEILWASRKDRALSRASYLALANQIGEIGDQGFSLIHAQYTNLGRMLSAGLPAWAEKLPLVVSVRGPNDTEPLRRSPQLFGAVFRKARFFMPVSQRLGELLVERGCPPEKIRVVRSGIDLEKMPFSPVLWPSDGPIRICMAGRMVPYKGMNHAIEAIRILKDRGRNVLMDIFGDGPCMDAWTGLARDRAVSDCVCFHGWAPQSALLDSLRQSHICLVPSLALENGEEEGIPNIAKEAMALGVVVISTHTAGLPELIQHQRSGYLVTPGNSTVIAEAVDEIATLSGDARGALLKAARTEIEERYATPVTDQALAAVYLEARGENRS